MSDLVQRLRDWACGGTNFNALLLEAAARIEQLEAALKPGEPVAWSYTSAFGSVQVFTSEPPPGLKEKCVPLYTAAPTAQTPAGD